MTRSPIRAGPAIGSSDRLADLILSRIGQDFDGECHLTEVEAREIADAIENWQARALKAEPVPMILFCPACGLQHIDEPEPALGKRFLDPGASEWTNPPHRSHLCAGCGHIWRPADINTTGVAAIATIGKADSVRIRDRALPSLQSKLNGLVEACRPFAEAALVQRTYDKSFTPEKIARMEADDGMCAGLFTNGQVSALSAALSEVEGGKDA